MEITDKIKLIKFIDDVRYKKDNIDAFSFETSYYYEDVSKYFDLKDGCFKYKDVLTDEIAGKILLTHYLVYICDRQMKYQHIFKAGGYVISKLVQTYIKEKDVEKVYEKHIDKEKCCILAKTNKKEQSNDEKKQLDKIKKYMEERDSKFSSDTIEFLSRFCPTDIICIFKTLYGLKGGYNDSFSQFLNKYRDDDISLLAKEMYNLTYNVKQIDKDYIKCLNISELKVKNCSNGKEFDKHSAKRIWCVLRDFLYHPYFSECYRKILKMSEDKFREYKKDQIPMLELPGDVWNNNKKFSECFWTEYQKNMSKYVRKHLKDLNNNNESCFPINFDVTFLFVPKMCDEGKCNLCPFNKKINIHFANICHETSGKYCSFLLYSTGIKYKCPGDKSQCELQKFSNKYPIK